jgi:class 3 adenylate cyclase
MNVRAVAAPASAPAAAAISATDPEDLREIISAYQKCVAETVRRFDGFVAKYMGDGVLVYFGYPQAHEHDAESSSCGRSNNQRERCREFCLRTTTLRKP